MAAISLRRAFYPLYPEKTMYRLVAVAAALMALACNDHSRNSARNAMANAADSARSMAQSAGSTATGMADSARSRTTAMAESAKSTMGNMADSSNTTANNARDTTTTASAASDTGKKTTSSAGALAPSNAKTPAKLTRDQLKQLQAALNSDGCSVGTADGVMGAKTTKGVACSMKKHNIQNNDYSALYQALNLSF